MIKQIVKWNRHAKILFDHHKSEQLGIPTNIEQEPPSDEEANSTGNDATLEDIDAQDAENAVKPITDELYMYMWKMRLWTWWWIIEICTCNWGSGRRVPPGPKFHNCVKLRMNDPNLKYKPRAHYEKG